ncbi:GNAT family N-acetyltransferase [Acinetobacter sp. MD2(2019)]|uniref:GNAT family N-acetyltransferase n=1 Tax=Acinetobacter sp. MD2(2019) TaxID=2605273 RepID=UPI002D1F9090|nr:GNAT family N-acetyltransferase [Acinetobacter sp. MD2(2019)]MEB3754624.1 GNAT family N-acetyltransferase [Acinetobacter sp. MD2(2019)]
MSNFNLTIRAAQLSDLEVLADLFNQYRAFYGKSEDHTAAPQFLQAHLNNATSQIYVAEIENQLAGFVQLYPSWSSLSMGKIWIVNDLFVQQDFRQFGVGKALMNQAIAFAKQHAAVYVGLETGKENFVAQRLYQQLGFEIDHDNYHLYLNG